MYDKRVLALNDGNHDTTFYFENDSTGFETRAFVKYLANPHAENIHVRYVYLLDIPDDDIKAQQAFDIIDWRMTRVISWREAYDFLWEYYGKEW